MSIIFYSCFGLFLVLFHGIQWVCFYGFGYRAQKNAVELLNFFLLGFLNLLGTRVQFDHPNPLPKNRSIIFVANHQSTYDIPPLIWYLRKHHPKFISKKELGKGIPSVSYNLRHGGSVLINRKEPLKSIKAIENFAIRIAKNNWAAVIFPEGTRSRNGKPKPFKTKGLITMFEFAPNAVILPVSINNSWKTLRYGKFPMGLGAHITFDFHKPIELNQFEDKETLIKDIEATITKTIIL